MAEHEVSRVVELDDKEVIKRNKAANTVRKTRQAPSIRRWCGQPSETTIATHCMQGLASAHFSL
jgi:hypothetical protein